MKLEWHPNIVQCFSLERLTTSPFLKLEWVFNRHGRVMRLCQWLQAGELQLRTALDLAMDVCCGLEHAAHQASRFVHRDLKPENILVADGPLARITDFGVAIAEDEQGPSLAPSPYRSPEQRSGETLDARADIYALGCILHEMLTGRRPSGEGEAPVLVLPDGVDPTGRDLVEILARCLAEPREERFPDVRALREALSTVYERQFGRKPATLEVGRRFSATDCTGRGVVFEQLQRYGEALDDHNRALEMAPQLTMGYINRGNTKAADWNFKGAIEDYTRAIELSSDDARPYINRGSVFERWGKHDEALSDYDRAVGMLKPQLVQTYGNRGVLKHKTGDIAGSRRDLEFALALDPQDPRTRLLMGTLEISLGNLEAAMIYVQDFPGLALPRGEVADTGQLHQEVDQAFRKTMSKADEEKRRVEAVGGPDPGLAPDPRLEREPCLSGRAPGAATG